LIQRLIFYQRSSIATEEHLAEYSQADTRPNTDEFSETIAEQMQQGHQVLKQWRKGFDNNHDEFHTELQLQLSKGIHIRLPNEN